MSRLACALAVAASAVVWAGVTVSAQAPPTQGGRPGGPGGTATGPLAGRVQAPFDITGYWVSLVTDDWRYRMLTPPKGNADYLPITPEARKVMDAWDPAKDEAAGEACRAYGAAGVMRLPTRLHITWENDNTLRMDLDAGTQTRRFVFGVASAASAGPASAVPAPAPTWQGVSVARWQVPVTGRGRGPTSTGQLVATTTRMRPGYLRRNGVPYGGNAALTEYFVRLVDGTQEYLVVTTMVDDSQYLAQPYVKTYQYKKETDGSGWNPTPCSAR